MSCDGAEACHSVGVRRKFLYVYLTILTTVLYSCLAIAADGQSNVSKLTVRSNPSGAVVRIAGHPDELGKFVGVTPLETTLSSGRYWVQIALPGYEIQRVVVDIDAEMTNNMAPLIDVHLLYIYPRSNFKKIGHALFWSGLTLVPFGFVARALAQPEEQPLHRERDASAIEDSKKWTGLMLTGWIGGGLLMTSGIVLWSLFPSSKTSYLRRAQLGFSPVPQGGAVMSYSRSF